MRDVLRRDEGYAGSGGTTAEGREKRVAPRFTLLIRAAKLITSEGEFLCIVRDASETGVNIRIFHPLPNCGQMLLEMQNGDQHQLELVWQEGDRAGLKFLDAADIARIIESPSRYSKRPIRIGTEFSAIVLAGVQQVPVKVRDISQQGAKVICDYRFAIDQRVKLKAEGLPEVYAKVRWRRDDCFGLVFDDTFQFGDLARIVAAIQGVRSNFESSPGPAR